MSNQKWKANISSSLNGINLCLYSNSQSKKFVHNLFYLTKSGFYFTSFSINLAGTKGIQKDKLKSEAG